MEDVSFPLRGEYIELIQLLKACGVAPHGAAAKQMVSQQLIRVNGQKEERFRRKISAGMLVETPEMTIRIVQE
jgi:ribosome-associated protein